MVEHEPNASNPVPLRRRTRLFEIVIGACAILISVVSLFVAISANRTQERMLAASVWPSLIFATSNVASDGTPQVTLDLLNRGTGPARLRWAEVRYDGVPVAGPDDLLSRCCGEVPRATQDGYEIVSSGIQNRVLGAEEWVALLRMPRPEPATAAWDAMNAERRKVTLRACYCSVLDDCWMLDSTLDEPQPIAHCPVAPAVLWQG